VLVELLVALTLLGVVGNGAVRLVRGAVIAADRIAHLGAAQALVRDAAEALQASPCAPSAGALRDGRTEVAREVAGHGPLTAVELVARRIPPPGAGTGSGPRPLAARAAGWCP
jgi:hypothetical protein